MIRQIWRGMQYSDEYGSHPGTPIVLGAVFLGGLAGGWVGAVMMLVVFGALYLYGAYERGR